MKTKMEKKQMIRNENERGLKGGTRQIESL